MLKKGKMGEFIKGEYNEKKMLPLLLSAMKVQSKKKKKNFIIFVLMQV